MMLQTEMPLRGSSARNRELYREGAMRVQLRPRPLWEILRAKDALQDDRRFRASVKKDYQRGSSTILRSH